MIRHRVLMFAACVFMLATAVFAQTGNVQGIVLLPNQGGPAAGATVTLHRMQDSLVTTSDAEGHFSFTGVATGGWGVRAVLEGYLPANGMARVFANQTANVTLLLRPLPTGLGNVAGRVLLPNFGGPAIGALVVLMVGPGDSLTTTTNDSGRFAFNDIAVGPHPIYAVMDGYLPGGGNVFVPDGGTGHITLFLRPVPTGFGDVAGRVLLPHMGGPVMGATVVLILGPGDSLTTTSDDSGHFAFADVTVGPHPIYAVMEGYVPAFAQVFVPDGGTARINLFLHPVPTGVGRVEGVVLLPFHDGPAAGATVVLFRGPGDSLVATANDSGRFVFEDAAVGRHPIYATLEGYLPAFNHVFVPDGGTGRIMLVLRPIPAPPGVVTGTVLLSDNTPARGAWVGLHARHHHSRPVRTDSLGHFIFPHVPPGDYRITASLWNHGFAMAEITVVSEETLDVTLVLADSTDRGHQGQDEADAEAPEIAVTHFTSQNYPNPFNPTTTIRYSVPEAGLVTLSVFDITGRQVAELVNSYQNTGEYHVQFDGSSLASGVYFYKLTAGNQVRTERMLLMK